MSNQTMTRSSWTLGGSRPLIVLIVTSVIVGTLIFFLLRDAPCQLCKVATHTGSSRGLVSRRAVESVSRTPERRANLNGVKSSRSLSTASHAREQDGRTGNNQSSSDQSHGDAEADTGGHVECFDTRDCVRLPLPRAL